MDTTNEPVAWMDEINTFVLDEDYKQFPKSLQNGMIPLYIHPVKELTDAELYELLPINLRADEEDAFMFARAVLRKAQE
jgi:hypothetical protein